MKWFKFLIVLLILNFGCDVIPPTPNAQVAFTPISEEGNTVWITGWIPSDESNTFWYRISRTKNQVDVYYNYRYDLYFLSNDFILLENVIVTVNNVPIVNTIEKSVFYDLTFQGDIRKEVGDLKVSFLYTVTNHQLIKVEWDSITII